jgi:hypothetical protein
MGGTDGVYDKVISQEMYSLTERLYIDEKL